MPLPEPLPSILPSGPLPPPAPSLCPLPADTCSFFAQWGQVCKRMGAPSTAQCGIRVFAACPPSPLGARQGHKTLTAHRGRSLPFALKLPYGSTGFSRGFLANAFLALIYFFQGLWENTSLAICLSDAQFPPNFNIFETGMQHRIWHLYLDGCLLTTHLSMARKGLLRCSTPHHGTRPGNRSVRPTLNQPCLVRTIKPEWRASEAGVAWLGKGCGLERGTENSLADVPALSLLSSSQGSVAPVLQGWEPVS